MNLGNFFKNNADSLVQTRFPLAENLTDSSEEDKILFSLGIEKLISLFPSTFS